MILRRTEIRGSKVLRTDKYFKAFKTGCIFEARQLVSS